MSVLESPRLRIALPSLLVALAIAGVAAAPAMAAPSSVIVAQAEGEDSSTGTSTEQTTGTEAGPLWTYQMARITVVLTLGLGLAIGLMYYRLIVKRRRGEV